jgi:hypothetical protein
VRIGPTGKCFDNALDEFQRLVKEDKKRQWTNEYVMAHGILIHEDTGERYAHAWLEANSSCFDFGIVLDGEHAGEFCCYEVEKTDYYRGRQVVDVTFYTWNDAKRWNMLTNHFGPWLPKYRELCKDIKQARERARKNEANTKNNRQAN